MNEIIKIGDTEINLSPEIVLKNFVSGEGTPSSKEIAEFINICKYQKLNPFLREAYFVKYGNAPATIVVGKDVYSKRAAKNPKFDGIKSGIVVKNLDNKIENRQGQIYIKSSEKLIGGWAEVYLKNLRTPIFKSVMLEEYIGLKKDGTPNRFWKEKPATMIEKVAIVHAKREAFPEEFQNLFVPEEMGIDIDLPQDNIDIINGEFEIAKTENTIENHEPEPKDVMCKILEKYQSLNLIQDQNKKRAEKMILWLKTTDDPDKFWQVAKNLLNEIESNIEANYLEPHDFE